MKNRILAWVAAAVLAISVAPQPAHAQLIRLGRQTLEWSRSDQGATPNFYVTPRSDGNHPIAGLGIAVAPQDTAVVGIADHAFNWRPYLASAVPPGALADSMWSGTLTLRGSTSTIDSLKIFIDRGDGVTWTGTDSLSSHMVSSQTVIAIAQASDSASFIAASVQPSGAVAATTQLVIQFWGYSPMGTTGVTAQAWGANVRALRIRIHMTPGDYAAAGTSQWVAGEFVYPAFTSFSGSSSAP